MEVVLANAPETFSNSDLQHPRLWLFCHPSIIVDEVWRFLQNRTPRETTWELDNHETATSGRTLLDSSFALGSPSDKNAIICLESLDSGGDIELVSRQYFSLDCGEDTSVVKAVSTQSASILTPAMLTKKIDPYDQWVFCKVGNNFAIFHRRNTTDAWKRDYRTGLSDDTATSIASCVNRQGIWVFTASNHIILKTMLWLCPHGESKFREICKSTKFKGEAVGAISSWLGNPRLIMQQGEQIFEVSYNGEGFQEPIIIGDEIKTINPLEVSVAYQKEVDTPNGHMPETATVIYSTDENRVARIRSFVWTKTTGTWMRGADILNQ